MATARTEIVTLTTKVNELTVLSEKAVADLAAATTQLETLATEKSAAEEKTLIDAEWKKVAAMYGLQEKDRAAREPILKKIIAKKETVSVEEFTAPDEGRQVAHHPAHGRSRRCRRAPGEPRCGSQLKKTMPGATLKRQLWH